MTGNERTQTGHNNAVVLQNEILDMLNNRNHDTNFRNFFYASKSFLNNLLLGYATWIFVDRLRFDTEAIRVKTFQENIPSS